ncbi:MAG: hypothetical protein J5I98_31440 [Phaeodactylibacter sp.]|nr:hypothetical protein [Phaeodactylibacter sp.]
MSKTILSSGVVNTVEVRILPEDPSLCYRDMPGARPGRNAAPTENRAVGCTQEYVVLSLDGAYATAEWSTGITGDSIEVYEPSLYSVSVMDANGCEGEAQAEVAMCTAIPLSLTASGPQLCEDTVAISAPEGFAAYQWSTGDAAPGIQATATGVYAVTVEDSGGCLAVDSVAIEECTPLVDIRIFDGFYDWASGTSWSGGQMVPDAIEASKGAVTVANLNDTDGDTIPDYQDMSVTASLVGRNEIDLMKLLVLKPQPYSGGSLKLRVLEGGQRVKFWKAPTKEDSLASASPNEYNISFGNAPDSLTFYLEATGHSDTLRDIVIEASYGGKRDTVAATAFWVEKTNVWINRAINPIPSYTGGNCNCPANMGNHNSSNDKWIAGRIFWEFGILPNLAPAQYHALNLEFDVTRQRQTNTCKIISGQGYLSGCQQDKFPWLIPQDNEMPNDDSGPLFQNDNTPSSFGSIYSFDPPGSDIYDLANENLAFKIYRATFKEFVRIQLSPFNTGPGPNSNLLEGSRASKKMDWYTTFHIRRFSDGLYKMELDDSNTSVSKPIKGSNTNSNGNIILSVVDISAVSTNGYRVEYNSTDRLWNVQRMVNGVPSVTTVILEGPSGTWTGAFEGVSIQITEGSIPFAFNDYYSYSTYATQNTQGKINELNIGNQPFNVYSPF